MEKERKKLKAKGYYVDNLWHIEDVQSKFECTDEEAYNILGFALQNEATYDQIWLAIEIAGEVQNLKRHEKEMEA